VSIEIMKVGLDEATIDLLAERVAQRLQSVTPSRSDTHSERRPDVSSGGDQGWQSEPSERADAQPASERRSDSTRGGSDSARRGPDLRNPARRPVCDHAEMNFVKAGYSERAGKSYPAFWACSGPRELSRDEKCATINAQEWFDRVAGA
jgi:hypothetical protein